MCSAVHTSHSHYDGFIDSITRLYYRAYSIDKITTSLVQKYFVSMCFYVSMWCFHIICLLLATLIVAIQYLAFIFNYTNLIRGLNMACDKSTHKFSQSCINAFNISVSMPDHSCRQYFWHRLTLVLLYTQ